MNMLIGGQEAAAANGGTFENRSPFTGELVCTVPDGTAEDFERAAELARAAQPAWGDTPFYERAACLRRFIELVRQHTDEIAPVVSREGGKLIGEARGELACLCYVFEEYIEAARHLYGHAMPLNTEPRTQGDVLFTLREPLGVVVTITPYNFPVELYAHKVAPALIGGNAVIIKPASDTPMGAYLLTRLLWQAGVPGDVAQLITGRGRAVGDWLRQTKLVDAVSFTGSTGVGQELMRGGADNLQRVFLELGGNDPYVVFHDCDLERAVEQAIGGRCYNAGQTCCANKRFIVQNGIREAFTARLIERLRPIRLGDPLDPATEMGPQVSEQAAKQVEEQIAHTVRQGARLAYGGGRRGSFVEPAVLTDVTPDMDVARDLEIFGPVFPIIGFDTFEEAVAVANQTSYGLASGVMTSDMSTALRFASRVKAGTCVINSSGNYRSVQQPFGGYKHSGIGREGTSHTLLEMTQEKTVVLKDVLK